MTKRGKSIRYSINYKKIYGKDIPSRPRRRREEKVCSITTKEKQPKD